METTHDEVQDLATTMEQWAAKFLNCYRAEKGCKSYRHVVVCGNVGTGKTSTAEAMWKWSSRMSVPAYDSGKWGHPPRIEWVEWAQIAFLETGEFRNWLAGMDGFGGGNAVDLLFMEDIGAEADKFKSGEPAERLREVLNYFKNKWLFITTNVMPDKWKDAWDARISDRLMRDSVIVTLRETPSYSLA